MCLLSLTSFDDSSHHSRTPSDIYQACRSEQEMTETESATSQDGAEQTPMVHDATVDH